MVLVLLVVRVNLESGILVVEEVDVLLPEAVAVAVVVEPLDLQVNLVLVELVEILEVVVGVMHLIRVMVDKVVEVAVVDKLIQDLLEAVTVDKGHSRMVIQGLVEILHREVRQIQLEDNLVRLELLDLLEHLVML